MTHQFFYVEGVWILIAWGQHLLIPSEARDEMMRHPREDPIISPYPEEAVQNKNSLLKCK